MPNTPLENIEFVDYIDLRQYKVNKDQRNKFLDTVYDSIEKQKNETSSENVKGLQIVSIDTHSGLVNGNIRYYHPYHDKKSIASYTQPYNKPVLRYHDAMQDAIGRITDAQYIETPHPMIDKTTWDILNNAPVSDKKTLKAIDKIRPFLNDPTFEGLGYVKTVKNIVDKDSIEKIVDGRYSTISISFKPEAVYCSECGQNFVKDGMCEHRLGSQGKKGKVFWIYGDKEIIESSFVNEPADKFAQITSKKRIEIPSDFEKDFISFQSATSYNSDIFLHSYDSKTKLFIPQFEQNINNHGDKMNLKELYSKDLSEVYSLISDKVAEGSKISFDELDKLEDSNFLGGTKFFPISTAEYADAVSDLLNELEDSEEKTELLELLAQRKQSFNKDSVNTSIEDEAIKDEEQVQQDEVTSKPTFEDEIKLRMKDRISSTLFLNELINSLEDKDSYISDLAKDKIFELEGRIANYKKELSIWKDSEVTLTATIDALTDLAKKYYADKIIAFRPTEDPNKSNDELIEELKLKTLADLQASYESISLLFGDKQKTIELTSKEETTAQSFGDSNSSEPDVEVTMESLKASEDHVNQTYMLLRAKHPSQAEAYKNAQFDRINKLKNTIQTKANKN